MAYDEYPPLCLTLTFLDGMVDFSSHESIRVLFKDAQAGAGTEIDLLATIHGAGVFHRIFEFAATSGLVFGQ